MTEEVALSWFGSAVHELSRLTAPHGRLYLSVMGVSLVVRPLFGEIIVEDGSNIGASHRDDFLLALRAAARMHGYVIGNLKRDTARCGGDTAYHLRPDLGNGQ